MEQLSIEETQLESGKQKLVPFQDAFAKLAVITYLHSWQHI